jgi:N-acetyltransferase 10
MIHSPHKIEFMLTSTVIYQQAELQLPVNQALALFGKLVRKLSRKLHDIQKAAISATIPEALPSNAQTAAITGDGDEGAPVSGEKTSWKPVETSLETELAEAGDEATKKLREKQRAMIDALDLSK